MTIAIEVMVGKIIKRRFELKSVFQNIDFYSVYHFLLPHHNILKFSNFQIFEKCKNIFVSHKNIFFVRNNKISTEKKIISTIVFPLNKNIAEFAFLAWKTAFLGINRISVKCLPSLRFHIFQLFLTRNICIIVKNHTKIIKNIK